MKIGSGLSEWSHCYFWNGQRSSLLWNFSALFFLNRNLTKLEVFLVSLFLLYVPLLVLLLHFSLFLFYFSLFSVHFSMLHFLFGHSGLFVLLLNPIFLFSLLIFFDCSARLNILMEIRFNLLGQNRLKDRLETQKASNLEEVLCHGERRDKFGSNKHLDDSYNRPEKTGTKARASESCTL